MSRPDLYQLAAPIVSDVLDLDPSARERAITARCGGDDELAAEVRSLVSMDSHLNTEHPLGDQHISRERRNVERTLDAPLNTRSHIGKYKIVREIGRGGMSVVYECEQEQPKRRVAVKLIDARLAGRSLNHRLRLEAEILGRLRHDSIAQVYEAGITDKQSGSRPFFAMELINGVPLTEYADQNNLSTRARLELLARVADGVEHAHQKGVIHRDLKPGNILVTADGTPKILDFGIARIADSGLKITTMHTSTGAILGTLSYMSPEQATGNSALLDTRSDIYSLGVLGFELLAGQLPHELQDKPIHDAVRIICQDQTTVLSSIDRSLRGDIETIIGKALETEVDRRYASAAALADDIRRYLANEPIMARSPSTLYQVQKFTRRNRAVVGGTIATIVMLVGGIIFASYYAVAADHQRQLAEQRETQARHNNVKAMRGLFSAAQLFTERDEPWDAILQLNSIDEQERGWEWNHLSLRAPWLIDEVPFSRGNASESLITSRFINNHELFQFTSNGYTGVYDLLTDSRRQIQTQTPEPIRTKTRVQWPSAPENMFALRTIDDHLGVLDTVSGTFREVTHLPSVNSTFSRDQFNHDASLVASHSYNNDRLTVRRNNEEVFHLDTGLSDTTGMQWLQTLFLQHRPYLLLARWRDLVYVVDTRTWEVVSDGPAYRSFGVSADESKIYTATTDGIRVMAIPSMEYIQTIGAEFGAVEQVVVSATGTRVSANYRDDEVIRVFETESDERIFEASIGQPNMDRTPFMSPDGRLIHAESPDTALPWIIDLDEPEQPDITTLAGHESWIYQLAISPDGSLLASGAPEGNIILWDLENGTPLARFQHGRNLGHNMDMPLIFSPDGSELVYADLNPESGKRGLTRIELDTGTRSWTEHANRNEVIDAVAKMVPIETSKQLYHHTAVFDDGRILQSSAHRFALAGVVLRQPGEKGEQLPNIAGGRVDTGVAINPNGSTYATGEYLVLTIRDQETSEILHEIKDGISDITWGVCYSNDGTRLALGTEDGRVIVYDAEFFEKLCDIHLPLYKPDAERNYIFTMVWTPDDLRLVTCTSNSIRILESQRPIQREHIVAQWNAKLNAARQALEANESTASLDPAAVRVARIEQWAEPADTQ